MGERTSYSPGTFSWVDLTTTDQAAAKEFYGGLFGWEMEDTPAGDGVVYSMAKARAGSDPPYLVISNADGRTNGGIRAAASSEPCYWLVYFGSDELERSLATAGELGGSTLMEPITIGPGQFAAVQDPQGAV